MDLREAVVEPVTANEEAHYQRLMQAHHSLDACARSARLWYMARWRHECVALPGFPPRTANLAQWIG